MAGSDTTDTEPGPGLEAVAELLEITGTLLSSGSLLPLWSPDASALAAGIDWPCSACGCK